MAWVPWIETEQDDSSNEDVQNLYKKTRNSVTGRISDLTRLTSLTPAVSTHIENLRSAAYGDASGLTVREKEIAALAQSLEEISAGRQETMTEIRTDLNALSRMIAQMKDRPVPPARPRPIDPDERQ